MRSRAFFTLLLLSSFAMMAQTTHSIFGKVTIRDGENVPLGDVVLYRDANEDAIAYTILEAGRFQLESVAAGSYRLRISGLGLQVRELEVEVRSDLVLDIKMTEQATDLDEVSVTAAKAVAILKNGNLRINVDNPIFASIPDPLDLLSRFPGIQISPDRESLAILGKGYPLLYLGKQRISLEELKGLTVEAIESIEIIRNPSARYEASGRAVLLIHLKADAEEGVKLNLSETLSFRRNFNAYHGLDGSLKKDKWTFRSHIRYNDLLQWESHTFAFGIPEADIASDYTVLVDRNIRNEIQTGGSALYQLSENDYFSVNASYRLQTNDAPIATETFLAQGQQEDFILSTSENDNIKNFVTAHVDYNKALRKDLNLCSGRQYTDFMQHLDTEVTNDFNGTGDMLSEIRQQSYRIGVWTYRFDLEKRFGDDLTVEIGANISLASADADTRIDVLPFDFGSQAFEGPQPLTGRRTPTSQQALAHSLDDTNLAYTYYETTYASYLQLSGSLGKKISYNAGLRAETNQVVGKNKVESTPLVDRQNTALFPKLGVDMAIDSAKTLSVNYARSVVRPDYSRASSITTFINPFLEGAGNVNLRPAFTEELTASYQCKKGSLSVTYFDRQNPIYFTIGYEPGAPAAVLAQRNLDRASGYDINLNLPMTKGIWSSDTTFMLSLLRIGDADAIVEKARPYLYAYTDQRLNLGKDTVVSVSLWALTGRSEGIFERNAMAVFNAALTKTLWDKFDVALRWNDISRAMTYEERYAINGVNADGRYFFDGNELAVSLRYSLGSNKAANIQGKVVDENLDRID